MSGGRETPPPRALAYQPMVPLGDTPPRMTPRSLWYRMSIVFPLLQAPVTVTSWPRRSNAARTEVAILFRTHRNKDTHSACEV